ncbi:MAG: PDZ domain-containing protein, partial [Actinomycetota bacterium]
IALQTMQEGGTGRALVLDERERVFGLLTMHDIARRLEFDRTRSAEGPGRRSGGGWLLPVSIGAFVVGAAAWFYAPPFVIFGPGEAFDVTPDIKIEGYDVDDVNGKYLLTSVSVSQPNTFGFLAAILQGRPLQALGDLVPPDVDPDEFFKEQEDLFKERQRISAAAAARAAGLDVELTGTGAHVIAVRDGAPADGRLRADDVIVRVDGREIEMADDLSGAIRSRPAGTTFKMDVERGDDEVTVEVTSRAGILEDVPAIGVDIDTRDFDVDLPFEITFREREIGGPSAGLTYALAVYDLLEDSDLARGRSIATTGEMSVEGFVGAVGGVDQKAIGAGEGGADLFLVPENEVRLVGDTDLDVIGVRTLDEALEALA